MKLHIAPRGSGKTTSCFVVANKNDATVLMLDGQRTRDYISEARCREQGIINIPPTVGMGDSLAGIQKLVVDEAGWFLYHLLKKHYQFDGEIIYATWDSTNLDLEFNTHAYAAKN